MQKKPRLARRSGDSLRFFELNYCTFIAVNKFHIFINVFGKVKFMFFTAKKCRSDDTSGGIRYLLLCVLRGLSG